MMTESTNNETLFYHGTDVEIKLGDKILYSKLFRKVKGVVVYVPGQSKLNKNMEYEGEKTWAIQLDDEKGDIRTMVYAPPVGVVPKKIKFLNRQNPNESPVLTEDEEVL